LGGGTNKLVAKLAVELAKPRAGTGGDGVHVVAPGDEAKFVARLTLAEFPGVGPRFQEQLARCGWREVKDVIDVPLEELERRLGERSAAWLHDIVRGIDTSVVEQREEPKSMGREETFARDVIEHAPLERELLQLVDRVTSDLRDSGYAARTVTVKLKDSDFTLRSAARTLDEPITTYHAMAPIAKDLLRQLRKKRRVAARLIGVSASHLTHIGAEGQLALFEDDAPGRETERQRNLAAAMDSVRSRYGRGALKLGQVGEEE
jgi:DNA polymerase-4